MACYRDSFTRPNTVAAWSEARTVFARSNAGIVGSNPTQDMNVCVRLFCVCAILFISSGLAAADPPSKESYRSVKMITKLRSYDFSLQSLQGKTSAYTTMTYSVIDYVLINYISAVQSTDT
jgi:hypothetical protein